MDILTISGDDGAVGVTLIPRMVYPSNPDDAPFTESIFEVWSSVGGSIRHGAEGNYMYIDWPSDIAYNGGPIGYA